MKILFTVAVVVAVWQGFKWLNRRQQMEAERSKADLERDSAGGSDGIEDMVQCPDCGAYIAKGSDHRCT